ncbi:hypothetical protein [Paenibacillus apiarius]|uniref:Uncharacterized protein n=1 Tax=Paenibacillus apiarius TaxID=46240 RepID=A0ABT4DMX5_9BACL|nr:hypothetical protein [Paenibacillus apiarius]MCY9514694.1 hypothetical protein [Paenibacillus apiarius]MCY9518684.1 hypothetical protein [Paenibacillus apiarius]MCY9552875.1 hypothetical protein [Paenibacillus apiarius]MCY9556900.1 hypothetical protein [Paenibacillus apiarius]MCY9686147.1 hypothetical protein [Paenibacillus apiarius]
MNSIETEQPISNHIERTRKRFIFGFSAVMAAAWMLLFFFSMDIGLWGTASLFALFALFFVVSVVWAIIDIIVSIVKRRSFGYWALILIPIAAQLAAVYIALELPLHQTRAAMDDWMYREQRQRVIERLTQGGWDTGGSEHDRIMQLPEDLRHLSRGGGEIVVVRNGESLQVLFFTIRGMLDNFSGLVYVSEGKPDGERLGAKIVKQKELGKHWFWISGT